MSSQKTVHIKVERYIPHGYRTSCSNVGLYYQWVSATGAGWGTSVWSERIPTHRCNNVEENSVPKITIHLSVWGAKFNRILFERNSGRRNTRLVGAEMFHPPKNPQWQRNSNGTGLQQVPIENPLKSGVAHVRHVPIKER